MAEFEQALDFVNMAKDLVGKNGPVVVDTGINEHSSYLLPPSKKYKTDKYILKKNGGVITFGSIIRMLEHCSKHIAEYSDNRTYFYEGLSEHKGKYYINWGS